MHGSTRRSPAGDGMDAGWEELLQRVQQGDQEAFAALWRRHHASLVRYLEIVAGRDQAEDLASETWISVVRSLPRFEGGETGFRSLLFTLARSRLIDGSRRAQARPQVVRSIDGLDRKAEEPDAGAGIERDEATSAALALIARLPAGQAEIVALRVVAGLDNAEVALIVGKSNGAVRVGYSRGLATLAEMVELPAGVTDRDSLTFR